MRTTDSRFAQCIYFTSNALARKTEKLAQDVWKKVSLSPSHAYLLMTVIETPGVLAGQLALELQLQPSTITRLIEKLEQKKLITRQMAGKTTTVYPTAKAKDLLPKLKECRDQFYNQYNELLGKEESMRLVNFMGKMADKLNG